MRTRHFWAFAGAVAGLLWPVCWLLWRAYLARRAWWLTWMGTEWHRHYPVYVCLGLAGLTVGVVIGYLIGLRNDRWIEESQSALDHNVALSRQAVTDPLTGLFNGRAIHERLDAELEDSFKNAFSCLLIDIDHFKRINDRHGHPFGDVVLVAVAGVLKQAVRRVDAVGRLGGEEFIVLLPNTPLDRATMVAERVRAAVEKESVTDDGKTVSVTVSVGVATYPATGLVGKHSLLKAADDALYQAKHEGRNRVVVWTQPTHDASSSQETAA